MGAVYFWAAQTGDTLLLPNEYFNGSSTDTVVHAIVDSAGMMLIDTNHLHYYVFHLTDSCSLTGGAPFTGKAVERIGMLNNQIFPHWACVTDDTYYRLCSYQDNSFAIYAPDGCSSLPNAIKNISEISFQCKPNPAQDKLYISMVSDESLARLSIKDINGSEVLSTTITQSESDIPISDIANGLYFVSIMQGGIVITKKVIVMH